MPETILVIGATGMLGEPVARSLAKSGHRVRVMSRNLSRAESMFCGDGENNFEAVEGNVNDVESLRIAMEGCTGCHVNLSGDSEQGGMETITKVAAKVDGMKRISVITGCTTSPENAWFPSTRAKLNAESAIKSCGISYTIFRCSMFMESLRKWAPDGKSIIVGKQPTLWHWIAAKDYARMVANAYSSLEASANKTLYVYGPETLTMEQALRIYLATCCDSSDAASSIQNVPFWQARIISWFPGKDHLRNVIIPWMEYFTTAQELGGEDEIEEANRVLSAPTVTVKEWCEAYRDSSKDTE